MGNFILTKACHHLKRYESIDVVQTCCCFDTKIDIRKVSLKSRDGVSKEGDIWFANVFPIGKYEKKS